MKETDRKKNPLRKAFNALPSGAQNFVEKWARKRGAQVIDKMIGAMVTLYILPEKMTGDMADNTEMERTLLDGFKENMEVLAQDKKATSDQIAWRSRFLTTIFVEKLVDAVAGGGIEKIGPGNMARQILLAGNNASTKALGRAIEPTFINDLAMGYLRDITDPSLNVTLIVFREDPPFVEDSE